LVTKAEGQGNK